MRLDKFSNVWQQLSDANRPIRLFIALQEDGSTDLFLAQQVSGVETMCGAIVYSVRCVAQTAGLALKQLIACPVQLQFVTASGALQAISGIVSEVHEGGSDGALASYQLIVRDAFSLLDQSCNTRFFSRRPKSISLTPYCPSGASPIQAPRTPFALTCAASTTIRRAHSPCNTTNRPRLSCAVCGSAAALRGFSSRGRSSIAPMAMSLITRWYCSIRRRR